MTKLFRLIALLLPFTSLLCCKNKPATVLQAIGIETSAITPIEKKAIKKALEIQTEAHFLGVTINRIYEENDFEPIWHTGQSLNNLGISLVEYLNNASNWGINPLTFKEILQKTHRKDIARKEVELTQAALVFLAQVSYGTIRTKQIFETTGNDYFHLQLVKEIKTAIERQHFGSALELAEPKNIHYSDLKLLLSKLVWPQYHFSPLWNSKCEVCPDSIVWQLLKQAGYQLSLAQYGRPQLNDVLACFQKQHNLPITKKFDFNTFTAFLNNSWQLFSIIELNIERLKQNPPLASKYIWVNIPAFRLEVILQDKVIHQTRVVVGSPKTPTPVLSGKISHVITYPSWNIPASIIRQEIIPSMKRDSNYLRKKGYMVSSWMGQQLSYSAVLQSNAQSNHFPFNISQPPGTDNALGTLKFLFNNSESIYLHDTNARSYFSRQYRALSHGCVRVQDPHKLAVVILDSTSVVQMDKQLANKTPGHIKVTKDVAVYLRYITCAKNADGNIQLFNDIYHLDNVDRVKIADAVMKLPNCVN